MHVIEGYTRKSLAMVDYLNNKQETNEKILLVIEEEFRHSGVWKGLTNPNVSAFIPSVLDEFIYGIRTDIEKMDVDEIVFYVNVSKDNIEYFKELEDVLKTKITITVQIHAKDFDKVVEYDV